MSNHPNQQPSLLNPLAPGRCDVNLKNVIFIHSLTLKHREMHGCVVSTVATDALVLKHQAISIHNAD